MTALHVCSVKHQYSSTDLLCDSQAMWLFHVWQTSNKKLSDYCAKLTGYVPVSLICMNPIMSYSELPDISSNLSKDTAGAATLCHECWAESGGQDECF